MLPECVILNCVNSASKFPTVFLKVTNVFSLLGVRERGLMCSEIWRVSGVPLFTSVAVMSKISLSRTVSSSFLVSLISSLLVVVVVVVIIWVISDL